MSVYDSDPDSAPDSVFEPGILDHLVIGNRGRLLDPRRTPVLVVGVDVAVGMWTARIEAFEDKGARWEIPFEEIDHYQFEQGGQRASAADVEGFRDAIVRLDRPLEIPCEPAQRDATEERLAVEQARAGAWLASHSSFLAAGGTLELGEGRTGDERLYEDLSRYMTERDVGAVEEEFARQFVSNPYAGEIVKGHRIVLAEMGLVRYQGKTVRDPATFESPWDRITRQRHLETRLGFVRALFERLDRPRVTLYRGMSTASSIEPPRNNTFVSATFSRPVAESHFDGAGPGATRLLQAQDVPVERVLMTFLETAAMNKMFEEAEAVLLFDAGNTVF